MSAWRRPSSDRVGLRADPAPSIEQKLHGLGIFDRIWTAKVPATHLKAVLVVRFLSEHEDSERSRRVDIRLEDEDGRRLFGAKGQHNSPLIEPGQTFAGNLLVELNNLPLPRFGRYSFVVVVDEQEAARIPLEVTELRLPAAPGS